MNVLGPFTQNSSIFSPTNAPCLALPLGETTRLASEQSRGTPLHRNA
jgi:hypothetical protein